MIFNLNFEDIQIGSRTQFWRKLANWSINPFAESMMPLQMHCSWQAISSTIIDAYQLSLVLIWLRWKYFSRTMRYEEWSINDYNGLLLRPCSIHVGNKEGKKCITEFSSCCIQICVHLIQCWVPFAMARKKDMRWPLKSWDYDIFSGM